MVASQSGLLHPRVGEKDAHLRLVELVVVVVRVHVALGGPQADALAGGLVGDARNRADKVTVVYNPFILDAARTEECVL